jgi:hypothetical protein
MDLPWIDQQDVALANDAAMKTVSRRFLAIPHQADTDMLVAVHRKGEILELRLHPRDAGS